MNFVVLFYAGCGVLIYVRSHSRQRPSLPPMAVGLRLPIGKKCIGQETEIVGLLCSELAQTAQKLAHTAQKLAQTAQQKANS